MPRQSLAATAPGLITAERLATWLGMTPRAVRFAAAAGKIPTPKRVKAPGVRGNGVSALAWSEDDRDVIVDWAIGTGRRPWLPPHLREKFGAINSAFLRDMVVDAERGELRVVHGEGGDYAVCKKIDLGDGCSPSAGLASTSDTFRTARVITSLRREAELDGGDPAGSDIYMLNVQDFDIHGEETCTLIPLEPSKAWPFSLVFGAREVAEVLGRFPVVSGRVNPRLVRICEFRMDRPAEVHPALAVDDERRLRAARHLRSIIEDPATDEEVRQVCEVALAPRMRQKPAGKPFLTEALQPYTTLVLDTRHLTPTELDRLESLPSEPDVLFTDRLRRLLDTETLSDLAVTWRAPEHVWSLNTDNEVDAAFLRQAEDGGEPPFDLVVALAGPDAQGEDDLLADMRTRKVTSAAGQRIVLAEHQGRWVATMPRTVVAPVSPLERVDLPDDRRHNLGPALVTYVDGSIWPLHLGPILGAHMGDYIGGTPSLTLGCMLDALEAKAGAELSGRRSVCIEQTKAMVETSHTGWTREDLERIAAMRDGA